MRGDRTMVLDFLALTALTDETPFGRAMLALVSDDLWDVTMGGQYALEWPA